MLCNKQFGANKHTPLYFRFCSPFPWLLYRTNSNCVQNEISIDSKLHYLQLIFFILAVYSAMMNVNSENMIQYWSPKVLDSQVLSALLGIQKLSPSKRRLSNITFVIDVRQVARQFEMRKLTALPLLRQLALRMHVWSRHYLALLHMQQGKGFWSCW